jgi:hypothetical protein
MTLDSVAYRLIVPTPQGSLAGSLGLGAGVSVQMSGVVASSGDEDTILFAFSTPGDTGNFDQDAAEATIASLVTEICQYVAGLGSQSLTAVQSGTIVQRLWTWSDGGGFTAYYEDTMTYPPAA